MISRMIRRTICKSKNAFLRRPMSASSMARAKCCLRRQTFAGCISLSTHSVPLVFSRNGRYYRYSSSVNYRSSVRNDDDLLLVPREPVGVNQIVDGPSTRFGTGTIATLTESSVIGTAGTTVVLSTVAVDSVEKNDSSSLEAALLTFCNAQTGFAPLTVTYQERHHGVGRIPSNARRRDNLRSTDDEVLAGRAIDRALRPLLVTKGHMPNAIHLTCSVQAHDLWGECGSPVALALNSASVALSRAKLLQEPVACVYLCCMEDGTVIMDPTPSQVQESLAELLYAGTRTNVVMMECSSPTDRVPEVTLVDLMKVAHAALEPVFEVQQELISAVEEDETDDEQAVRTSLGLPLLTEENAEDPVITDEKENDVTLLFDEASKYIETQLKDSSLRLFGYSADAETQSDTHTADVSIQPLDQPLLSKALRGRREHVVFTEIERLLKNGFAPNDQRRKSDYDALVQEDSEALTALARAIHNRLLKVALAETATQHHSRGDGRGEAGSNGCRVVRPISIAVPALPDSVHGSAVFARGDTQVLCTATLGAPVDGIVKNNPYQETTDPRLAGTEGRTDVPKGPYDDLPVGSLRYLKSQEALLSDMNSRKVTAEKQITGESGTLDEVRRFFLHYDFPSFSTGEVPGRGMAANRRAIGHGALAEKAIRSTIPRPDEFPYTVRLTSEVTGSNGSSSMATVCGATLALLDAGTPINFPVAGVSVGYAVSDSEDDDASQTDASGLLLDITGTEDHYGAMDFKIAGTEDGVTALQLDVKRPLPMEVMVQALDLANAGRNAMLNEMAVLSDKASCGIISHLSPRSSLKDSAPRVAIVRFDPLRKRDLIGPGGAVLRQLEDRFGVSLDLTQEGQCLLYGANGDMVAKARSAVMDLVADVEEGEVYEGTVIEIKDFGAIVELLRNKEGLLHVSELGGDSESHPKGNLGIVGKHLRVGEKVQVLCIGVDPILGSIRLSRKQLLERNAS